ncbi:MAG: hypothetical protein ACOX5G_03055 [Kiritimatiellia bacterium]|jgi:hypothetical protein
MCFHEAEAIVARLATNAYYTACGSTAGITVNLAPSSHDPEGYTLSLDGTPIADGQPPWPVSVSNLAAGAHSLTLQSNTFPDLADEATLYVVGVDLDIDANHDGIIDDDDDDPLEEDEGGYVCASTNRLRAIAAKSS